MNLEELDSALDNGEVKTKPVPVPELGGSLTVRELSGTLRNAFEVAAAVASQTGDGKELERVTVRIVADCVYADDGKPVGLARAKKMFATKAAAAFRLRDEVIGVSAFSEEDFEELMEGFDSDPSGDSTSG